MRLTYSSYLLWVPVTLAAKQLGGDFDFNYPRNPDQTRYEALGPQLTAAPPPDKEYEYIVVGSGPGGSPVAARLAMAGHSVLLIDAGGDHGELREVQVPAMSIWSSERTELSWGYYTHHYEDEQMTKRDRKLTYRTKEGDLYSGTNPPEGAKVLGNYYPRVGGLGGCAEHNAMLAIYPHKRDWNYIKELTGDESWDAENMRKYFTKIEKNQAPFPSDLLAHGYSGWLKTALTPLILIAQDLKLLSVILGGSAAAGIKVDGLLTKVNKLVTGLPVLGGLLDKVLPLDYLTGLVDGLTTLLLHDINNNSPDRDSTPMLTQIPLSMGAPEYKRSSPRDLVYSVATAKNPDGSKKYKLDIALNTLVTKVQFNTSGEKPQATGVEYLFGESLYRADPRASESQDGGVAGSVSATREVIISAGTFNTPQILKLSGVGPKDELEKFDIPVVKDIPGVGTNLQDRYELGVTARTEEGFSLVGDCTFLAEGDPCYERWVTGVGPLKGAYTTGGIALGMFMLSSQAEGEHDVWVGGIPANFQGYYPGYSQNVLTATSKNHWTWLVLKAHTRNNAGTVNLTSTNPRDTPKITFHNFYEGASQADADKDIQAMIEGMRFGMKAIEDIPPIAGEFERVWPPAEISSDEDLKQWIQEESWGHHASSSCPIGSDDDPMAVLDSSFRVRGVDGLRVVDMSAFPKIMGVFPVVSLYMAAEKAADAILEDTGK
ncbi:Choline dehydrogenase [Colletotrichum higginsianum IMI 349063]|uniref:Choline dehydrogenase n=2 Tax=Colletotrichum higginsianum TaxID=80884 RepID=A0A1B7XTK6_COLHI|nr:Choline dehydrogenase [Colletotrichum higginsianum IMI 349063]OBR03086.1 Choline dehydrogenase [Colletotrichum higginsianum IMI 349063]TIC90901.1 Oxygen-dependent choline dehydrogenase [Colletotrichum higginsianum]